MGMKEVLDGSAWLDENFPGWEREIDLGTLEMADCTACICGQSLRRYVTLSISTGFDVAMTRATNLQDMFSARRKGRRWAIAHGFDASLTESYSELETLWRELIKERFGSGNLSDVV